MSLLAHSGPPDRKADAAPEALYNVFGPRTLDFVTIWALTLLRMLHWARKGDWGATKLSKEESTAGWLLY